MIPKVGSPVASMIILVLLGGQTWRSWMPNNTTTNLPVILEARDGFSQKELKKIEEHIQANGRQPLPTHLSSRMFEVYISGASLADIAKTFPECNQSSILYTAYHYNWPAERDEFVSSLQERIKQKLLYSKYQQLELVHNMIQVAHVEANNAMMAYIKNPCDKNLPKTLKIQSIKDLQMAIEMISSIVGQDNHKMFTFRVDPDTESNNVKPNKKPSKITDNIAKDVLRALNNKEADVIDAEIQEEVKK
jgi:hypothetical protein